MSDGFPIQTHPRFGMGLPEGVKAPPCPTSIPWKMVEPHDEQSQRNHGRQTLRRLAERGGLSPQEAVAVLEDRDWRRMPAKDACERLVELLTEFQERTDEMSDGEKNVIIVAGEQRVFARKDGEYFVDGIRVSEDVYKKLMEQVKQMQVDEQTGHTGMLFQHLEEVWLQKLMRGQGIRHKFVQSTGGSGDEHEQKRRYMIFTNDRSYAINASIRDDGHTYLGCVMSKRKPEAGEDFTGGGDLPDGQFCHSTWLKIVYAILRCELVPLMVRPTGEGTCESPPEEIPEEVIFEDVTPESEQPIDTVLRCGKCQHTFKQWQYIKVRRNGHLAFGVECPNCHIVGA